MYNFSTFENQYVIEGIIQLETPLHIGGGESSVYGTDNSVVKTVDGKPYIPGSSLKGVLRAYLERLAQTKAIKAPGYAEPCVFGEKMCLSDFNNKIARKQLKEKLGDDKQKFEDYLNKNSCPICHLFGNNLRAAKVKITDANVIMSHWLGKFEIREGVGIGRDKGTAVHGVKYDFEVVPANTQFQVKIIADNLTKVEEQWLFIALHSLIQGRIFLGGKIARGLGHIIGKDWHVSKFEAKNLESLLQEYEEQKVDFTTFLKQEVFKK